MQINTIKRPWQPKYKSRTNSNNKFYHTQGWKQLRQEHIDGHTIINGLPLANKYCIQCFEKGIFSLVHTVDHIIPIRQGGSKTDKNNLQSLCIKCNAVKTARDGQG